MALLILPGVPNKREKKLKERNKIIEMDSCGVCKPVLPFCNRKAAYILRQNRHGHLKGNRRRRQAGRRSIAIGPMPISNAAIRAVHFLVHPIFGCGCCCFPYIANGRLCLMACLDKLNMHLIRLQSSIMDSM